MDNFKGSFRPDIKTKKALVSALKTDFLGMEPDDIVNEVMSPEEYEFINSKLTHRRVDKVMSTDPLDLPALATEGGVKLNGHECDVLFWEDGDETMVRWLNKDLLEIHIEANQHLNRMMKNVHEKSEMIVQGKHHIHNLLNKVSRLQNIDFEDTDEEKDENELNDLFRQINEQTDEVEEY